MSDNTDLCQHCGRHVMLVEMHSCGGTNRPKTAALCPVCNGSGTIPLLAYERGVPFGSTGALPAAKTCHGCGGRGWVVP